MNRDEFNVIYNSHIDQYLSEDMEYNAIMSTGREYMNTIEFWDYMAVYLGMMV